MSRRVEDRKSSEENSTCCVVVHLSRLVVRTPPTVFVAAVVVAATLIDFALDLGLSTDRSRRWRHICNHHLPQCLTPGSVRPAIYC